MQEKQYGYVRVSSKDQNEARQLDAMESHQISQDCIFMDKQSGKDFNRPQYRKLLRRLRPGDVVVVLSIDRLGRDYTEILEQWRIITKEKQADIVVLDMPLLDTRKSRDLTGTLIADIVLQLLSYVAQTEREFIRQRQAEGIEAAKQNGKKLGRPALVFPANWDSVYASWKAGEITAKTAMEQTGTKRTSFYKLVGMMEE